MRKFAVLAILATAALSQAQADLSKSTVGVRIGYTFSGGFHDKDGKNNSLQGPEIGLSFPLSSFLGHNLSFEASIFGGGRLSHGGDLDADIYRFTAILSKPFGKDGMYYKIGGGFSHVSPRANGINTVDSGVLQIGLGMPVKGFLPALKPNFEVDIFAANKRELNGIFIGLSAGF